ncbi:hypothetical protein [Erythrobacter sp. Alg231-14]|uniref:hypothetical protein n=1 Tax=Erythrobacter sp. Alg231-14 TaxID=1922225 RepID=UPI00307C7E4F
MTALSAAAAMAMLAGPVQAQDAPGEDADYLEGLKACQQIAEDAQRLECFDSAVGSIVTASDEGEVQVVDRDDVRQTRRSLFGFNLPDLGIFGSDDDEEEEEEELFTTTVVSVRYLSSRKARFTTAEGAVWEMKNIPRRLRRIQEGDTVEFNSAALGYFFIRINGQLGVKGRRIQ